MPIFAIVLLLLGLYLLSSGSYLSGVICTAVGAWLIYRKYFKKNKFDLIPFN